MVYCTVYRLLFLKSVIFRVSPIISHHLSPISSNVLHFFFSLYSLTSTPYSPFFPSTNIPPPFSSPARNGFSFSRLSFPFILFPSNSQFIFHFSHSRFPLFLCVNISLSPSSLSVCCIAVIFILFVKQYDPTLYRLSPLSVLCTV